METHFISINGVVSKWEASGYEPEMLAGADFVYRKIHTLGHKVLQRDAHIELAERSCRALYGCGAGLTQAGLDAEVAALLARNMYPGGSNLVMLCLFPPAQGGAAATRLMFCAERMLYKGYAFWHKALSTTAVRYEVPLTEHTTAASLSAHRYMEGFARRHGADVAISVCRDGIATGVGEYPLFALSGNEVYTSPLEVGVPDTVCRRLGIDACRDAGLLLLQQPIEASNLKSYDELFTVTPQGITAIGSCDGHLYTHTLARRISTFMEQSDYSAYISAFGRRK